MPTSAHQIVVSIPVGAHQRIDVEILSGGGVSIECWDGTERVSEPVRVASARGLTAFTETVRVLAATPPGGPVHP